jgi:glycosyltransferase involved in cell wall biosynthesis
MFSELKHLDVLFFSPAHNSLPRHIRINFRAIRFLKQVGVSLWLFFNVHRVILEYGLDKLNIHSGPGGVFLLQRLSVPAIITCHHTYWQQATYIKSQFWKRIFLPLERRTYRLADRIVCVSADTRRILVDRYHIPEEKIKVIHNAVDTAKFYPAGNRPKRNTVLYVGRIDKRKGIEFLIRSMRFVVRQVPDALLLVGGKGSHQAKMKALVTRLNLERNVSFLGFVPDEQLNSLYNRAQCVVVPSIFEGFGLAVLEALAAGTRVVGTDVDGIRELLKDTDNGVLVKFGDCSALAGAILSELRDRKPAPLIKPEYRISRFAAQYRQVFDET